MLYHGECFVEIQTLTHMLESTFLMIMLMAIACGATVWLRRHLATVSWNG